MFYPDYLPLTNSAYRTQDQVRQFRDLATQSWQQLHPKLIDLGVALAGVVLTAISLVTYAGVTGKKAYRWLAPRLQAAYLAFVSYSETEPVGKEVNLEYKPSTNMAELLDNMDRCFEAMPEWIKTPCSEAEQPALTPDQFDALADMGADVAAGNMTEQEAIALVTSVDKPALESPDQCEDREFDPIPVNDLPTKPLQARAPLQVVTSQPAKHRGQPKCSGRRNGKPKGVTSLENPEHSSLEL